MNRITLFLLSFLVMGLFFFPAKSLASTDSFISDTTSVSKKDSTTQDVVLYPGALPNQRGRGFLEDSGQSLSTQISYIDGGLGLEMIYTVRESRSFFSLMLGMMEPNESLSYRMNLLTGLTYGYKATFSSADDKRITPAFDFVGQPDFYFRVGPGISTLGTDYYERGERQSELLIGFHTFGVLGSSVDIAERSKLNIELGWRGLWFPGAKDLKLMGGPHVSFGFSFSGGNPVDPVSW